MTQEKSFLISEFTNPSGEIVCRVSGWLDGKRVRKNFADRTEAEAERQVLEIQKVQAETGIRPTVTRLTEDQLQEAEALFQRLVGKPRSLLFYLDYALTNYKEPLHLKLLSEAVAEYKEAKIEQERKGLISASQVATIKSHMAALTKEFPDITVSTLNKDALATYLERGNVGLKTYNNRRGIVSTFLKYAENREWLIKNPIKKIPHHRIARRRGSAKTLTEAKARELMAYVETYLDGRLVPFFALCLFAGVRPCLRGGEIVRLKPEHIQLETGVIHIEPEVSKVREKRTITIQPNLAAWLKAYSLNEYAITYPNLQRHRAAVAKMFGLSHDVMRHTFISMHVAKFRSIGEASLQAGNSEAIIKKHYLDLKSPAEAEKFFAIVPTRRGACRSEKKPDPVDGQQAA